MATIVENAPVEIAASQPREAQATLLFIGAAIVILGTCAMNAALGHWAHQPNRDLFQHVAALRALISDLSNPSNPFVNSPEASRHFHPYWFVMAAMARTFGWTLDTTIAVASFLSVSVLSVGYYLFGRTYFRSDWGPLALLLSSLLAWSIPISHTGYVNIPTLVEGAAYPAALLVGLSLILWALIIKCFNQPKLLVPIALLCAFMFATHQLGAGLGFIVALSIIGTFPGGDARRRVVLTCAVIAGVALASLWPLFNPISAVIKAGNPTWRGGVDWYSPIRLAAIFVPSAIGIIGLLNPYRPGTGMPLLLALPILLAGFCAGAMGFLTGTRFAPMAILLLQVGIASILVKFVELPESHGDRFRKTASGVVFGTLLFQGITLGLILYPHEYKEQQRYGDAARQGAALTADIPDQSEVAAYDVASWPLVGSGQKVLSVPWPEPFIGDLAIRQRKVKRLFDVGLSKEHRIALAKQYGVRTLILDRRFGPDHPWRESQMRWPNWQIEHLASQSRAVYRAGPMWRFDLY